jgi:hypothetical protein
LPIHPDFVAVSTYNGYGFPDVLVAARGGNAIPVQLSDHYR